MVTELRNVPRIHVGNNEKVLDWHFPTTPFPTPRTCLQNLVANIRYHKNLASYTWYRDFRDLRLKSTDALQEVQERLSELGNNQAARDDYIQSLLSKSRSAVHIPLVNSYLCTVRQDLLTYDLLLAESGFAGVFNQKREPTATNPPPIFEPPNLKTLAPYQCSIFSSRYLKQLHDTTCAEYSRLHACTRLMELPTITVNQLQHLLADEKLPQRVHEAILMFIPNLSEPGAAAQVLLSPDYLQTDLARTAIYAAKNCLKHLPPSIAASHVVNVVRGPPWKLNRVTVMKELIRLSFDHIAEVPTRAMIQQLWDWEGLHKDVRVVIIQGAVRVIGESFAKGIDGNTAKWMWSVLEGAATKKGLKRDGSARALLAVRPTIAEVSPGGVPRRGRVSNSEVAALAGMTLLKEAQGRYLMRVLKPMCSKTVVDRTDADWEYIVNLRQIALQTVVDFWIVKDNVGDLAQEWRQIIGAEVPIPGSNEERRLWDVVFTGIAECVGRDPEAAWSELIDVVRGLADLTVDPESNSVTRRRAADLLKSLHLDSQPLLDHGLDVMFYCVALERQIALFRPDFRVSENENVQEGEALLKHIIDVTNEHCDDSTYVLNQIVRVVESMPTDNARSSLINCIVRETDSVVSESIFCDMIQLDALIKWGRYHIPAAEAFIDKVAKDDGFYIAQIDRIAVVADFVANAAVSKGVVREMVDVREVGGGSRLIAGFFARAKAAAWMGADADLAWRCMTKASNATFISASAYICPFLHECINDLSQRPRNGAGFQEVAQVLSKLLLFINRVAIGASTQVPTRTDAASVLQNISPAAALLLEAIADGRLGQVDLTAFLEVHPVPLKVASGVLFPFVGGIGFDGGDTVGRTMKLRVIGLKEEWIKQANEWNGYFTKIRKAMLTLPYPPATLPELAAQIVSAFTPAGSYTSPTGPSWNWAPPLSLALDFVDFLMEDVRAEVNLEGAREARGAEVLSGLVLRKWCQQILAQKEGKVLLVAEGVQNVKSKFEDVLRKVCQGAGKASGMETEWPQGLETA
ncbi:hypothetical protein HDV00_002465 [Rhizophlyctis rosea]|nr:hypothetical protein HDV00_002465 [Rhizophlyctis rosea]